MNGTGLYVDRKKPSDVTNDQLNNGTIPKSMDVVPTEAICKEFTG